jgi:hypothetical protein
METPATAPPRLGFEITHQPHEGGDGAKCGAKFADTPCVIYVEVTGVRSEWKECTEIAVALMSRLSIQTIILTSRR